MKPVIIITIAFVLLIPSAVFAQEGSRNMMEEYCLKNFKDDPQCENYTPKKIEQSKTEPPKASNPFEEFIQFIIQIFQGINPEETVKDVTKELSLDSVQNTLESTVDDISDSIPIDMEAMSGNSETKLEDCSKYKNEVKYSTDVDKVFAAVQKTDACEQRNKQITIKQGTATSQSGNYPTVTLKMDNKPSGGATADFKINTVRVVDSANYKIININMLMTMHMKLQDVVFFSPTAMWVLKSPSGEIYPEQCHGRQFDGSMITGKQNPNKTWDMCFHVEKELNKFDLLKTSTKIGTIILD